MYKYYYQTIYNNTISEFKERQTTVRNASQGAPCPRHFHYDLNALIFEIILLKMSSCTVNTQQKMKYKQKNPAGNNQRRT